MAMNYITNGDTIIFAPSFNNELDCVLLKDYIKIIFSNYNLSSDLFEKYENNNLQDLIHIGSHFNQSVDNLPSTITHLTFGYYSNFNQPVDNLPSSITYLYFGYQSSFNQSLNNLPRFTEFIQLPYKYDNKILNMPKRLKKIKCSTKYKYLSDLTNFVGLEVSTY
jgi:hypothetical protein